MSELPEITWTPAECEGELPIGTKVAIPDKYTGMYSRGGNRWVQCKIGQYLEPDSPYRPLEVNGNEVWVWVGIDALVGGIGFPVALKHCVPLGIEKQPAGWPNTRDKRKLSLEIERLEYNMSKDEFSELLIHWLKDNGYLKKTR